MYTKCAKVGHIEDDVRIVDVARWATSDLTCVHGSSQQLSKTFCKQNKREIFEEGGTPPEKVNRREGIVGRRPQQ